MQTFLMILSEDATNHSVSRKDLNKFIFSESRDPGGNSEMLFLFCLQTAMIFCPISSSKG